jgi:hypothetical protein
MSTSSRPCQFGSRCLSCIRARSDFFIETMRGARCAPDCAPCRVAACLRCSRTAGVTEYTIQTKARGTRGHKVRISLQIHPVATPLADVGAPPLCTPHSRWHPSFRSATRNPCYPRCTPARSKWSICRHVQGHCGRERAEPRGAVSAPIAAGIQSPAAWSQGGRIAPIAS